MNTTRDPSDAEDLTKVREFLDGDQRAFEFLFDKYRARVFAVAYRLVSNKEDALEVTQEAFLRASQGLHKFKTDSKFFTWLYRITVNRSIDFLRSRRARATAELPARSSEDGEDFMESVADARAVDPSRQSEEKEMAAKLMAAVDKLSEKHRAVFLLHAVEQLPYKEIAEVLDCSIGTVMSRLFYARKKLQQMLAQCGYLSI